MLLRKPEVLTAYRKCNSSLYRDIKDGLFPSPCKIGRVSTWPANEVKAVIDAYIAGKTQDDIKALVLELHAERLNRSDVV